MAVRRRLLLAALYVVATAGCGGGSSPVSPGGPGPSPTPPPPPSDQWAQVKATVDASPIANLQLVVGDASGVVLTYEKGNFAGDRRALVASASKLIAGATIMRLVESGAMSLNDKPQDYIPWWTSDPADARSRMTLAQLLSFTSGFNYPPAFTPCLTNGAITLEDCARDFYDLGVLSEPGAEYFYGAGHLEVAGLMAERATGVSYSLLVQREIASPLNLTDTTVSQPSATNPRVAGGGISTANEYAEFLRALLAGDLLNNFGSFAADRTSNVIFLNRAGAAMIGDWHYALGAWRECDFSTWNAQCDSEVIISSPGAFGWTPWVNSTKGYFGLIAMEDFTCRADDGVCSSATSLEQTLQPLIETVLN